MPKITKLAPFNLGEKTSCEAQKTQATVLRPELSANKILSLENALKCHFETSQNRDFGLPGHVPLKAIFSDFGLK